MMLAALGLSLAVPVGAAADKPAAPVVSPEPGTPDASPTTQISVFGVPRARIESVSVTGSLSGAHAGRLEAYSQDQGASFVLSKPLTAGENVTAVIRVRGLKAITDHFTIAHPGTIAPILNADKLQPAKLQHFVTEPALLPPKVTVERGASRLHDDIFLTPLPAPEVHPNSNNVLTLVPVGPGGPEIIDPNGNLVWFHQLVPPDVATDLRIQRYAGHDVLTWWQGGVTFDAFGLGEAVIANTSYQTLKTVKAGNGYEMDLHEFTLTPKGDALFTVYSPILVHLAGTPAGKLSPLLDAIVQEVDVRTGLVVWEWHAYGHLPLKDSYATPANSVAYDAYHVNSIEQLPDDRLLVSARDMSAVYDVDQATGKVIWTLGGKASSFKLGPGARFYFQHDAQMLGTDEVSLFDDEGGPPFYASTSRGIVLALNTKRHAAKLVHQYSLHSKAALADSEGSFQTLPNGSSFIGFGATQFFADFSTTGALQYEASLPDDDGSYREYALPWSATPKTKPVAAAVRVRNQYDVYASWNGATTVARWQVLAQTVSSGPWKLLRTVARHGFETETTETSVLGCANFEVRALNAAGKVLGTSKPIAILCSYGSRRGVASRAASAP
jgi:Arylsulfotransferase (ASST)